MHKGMWRVTGTRMDKELMLISSTIKATWVLPVVCFIAWSACACDGASPQDPDVVTARFPLGAGSLDVVRRETPPSDLPDPCGNVVCDDGWSCTASGECIECVPDCEEKECGDNGCGNTCGGCGSHEFCEDHLCRKKGKLGAPCDDDEECESEICAYFNAPGVCSERCHKCHCPSGYSCQSSTIGQLCAPVDVDHPCEGLSCGKDEFGGCCGWCEDWHSCIDGVCVHDCVGECDERECGHDGCGTWCGKECPTGEVCDDGLCQLAPPDTTADLRSGEGVMVDLPVPQDASPAETAPAAIERNGTASCGIGMSGPGDLGDQLVPVLVAVVLLLGLRSPSRGRIGRDP
jgi:hypothetical protein